MTEPTTYQRTETVQAIVFDPDVRPWPERVLRTDVPTPPHKLSGPKLLKWASDNGDGGSAFYAVEGRRIRPGDTLIVERVHSVSVDTGTVPPTTATVPTGWRVVQVVPKDKWAAQGWGEEGQSARVGSVHCTRCECGWRRRSEDHGDPCINPTCDGTLIAGPYPTESTEVPSTMGQAYSGGCECDSCRARYKREQGGDYDAPLAGPEGAPTREDGGDTQDQRSTGTPPVEVATPSGHNFEGPGGAAIREDAETNALGPPSGPDAPDRTAAEWVEVLEGLVATVSARLRKLGPATGYWKLFTMRALRALLAALKHNSALAAYWTGGGSQADHRARREVLDQAERELNRALSALTGGE